MSEHCPSCKSPLTSEGDCLRCLVSLATISAPTSHPTSFASYDNLKKIAVGGMGSVYQAFQPDLNRTVALKMLSEQSMQSADAIRRFQTETEAAASLDHPNIVSIFETGVIDQTAFYSMPYLSGGNLADFIKNGGHTQQEAIEIVTKISRAIAYAHRRGVLHRDLKPANILLNEEGEPQVADFGLAKLAQQNTIVTLNGAVLGTPAYMSPEQASSDQNKVGPTSDIYSLGAILYELITGKSPFQADTPLEMLKRVTEDKPLSPSSLSKKIPVDLSTITLKCLEKEPHKRYPSADALADDLDRFTQGLPLSAQNSTTKTLRRKLLISSAIITMLFIAAGILTHFRNKSDQKTDSQPLEGSTQFSANSDQFETESSLPREWVVTTPSDLPTEGKLTLREAIEKSKDQDTITFETSLTNKTISLVSGQLIIDKNLTINASALTQSPIIDARGKSRIVRIDPQNKVTINNLSFTNGNTTVQEGEIGGAILNNQSNLILNCCSIFRNSTNFDGGGIYNRGAEETATLTLNGCTLFENSTGSGGGGIYNRGSFGAATATVILNNCTLYQNFTTRSGGGIFNTAHSQGEAHLEITNCTIVGNFATSFGGGVFNDGGSNGKATMTISNTILAQNKAKYGADLWDYQTKVTATGTNLISNNKGYESDLSANTTLIAAPLLAPLGNYGGPTHTMPPLSGSPAIDAGGTSSSEKTDQRGFPRLVNEALDIGAVEIDQ